MNLPADLATRAIALLPGALVVYLGFNSGGFFPRATAIAVVVVAMVLLLRTALAPDPFAGFGPFLAVAAAALALYTGWMLLSLTWSDAPARALVEFNRSLLYLLLLILFGSVAWTAKSGSWLVRSLAAGIGIVAIAGLVTHLLPDVWEVPRDFSAQRLDYPATYWNTMGLLSAFGVILCLHLASNEKESPAVRVLGAAGVPVLATTVFFTFSRGAIAAGLIGVVVYAVAARPRGLVSGVLSTLPASAAAVGVAYGAGRLAGPNPTSAAAVAEGHDVALAVVLCAAGAAVFRLVLLSLDARLVKATVPRPSLRLFGVAAVTVLSATVVTALALNLPGAVADQYRLFATTNPSEGDLRSRLTEVSSKARLDHWKVALRDFEDAELRGNGAGTYQLAWERRRPADAQVRDAHSLYLEALGELGVVGLALLVLTVGVALAAIARRLRGQDRVLWGALFALAVAWTLRAGVDWDWEMPVVTVCFFIAAGAALGRSPGKERSVRSAPRGARVAIATGWLVVAVTPAVIALSEARLVDARRAFERRDCQQASDFALESISVLAARPEPYEILGYCNLRRGFDQLAVQTMEQAVDRDPRNWTFHYDVAVAQGAAGVDPRAEARAALRLNPLSPTVQDLVKDFDTNDPERWRRTAMREATDLEVL